MSHLSVLSDALLFLGRAIDPQAVTKTIFAFEHCPSDIGLAVWKFKVSLVGTKGIDGDGGTEVSFNLTWEGSGATDEAAVQDSFKGVQTHIQGFRQLREAETGFAEQALMVLTSGLPDGLWRVSDHPSDTHEEPNPGDADLQQMLEAAESMNGQSTSV